MSEQNQEKKVSRRDFLKNAGLTVGGIAVGTGLGSVLAGGVKEKEVIKEVESKTNFNKALLFFNQEQLKIAEAAAEQIFPKDDNGAGAKDLLVGYYIDHQLAGSFGTNGREYRKGPFISGAPTQGNQSGILNKDLFLMGVEALNQSALNSPDKKKFYQLDDEKQIEILKSFENGDVALNGTSSKTFFNLLKKMTIEGVYADPIYGGNANMEGWKMKKYPGNQMSYADIIEKDEFVVMKPQSLSDHQ